MGFVEVEMMVVLANLVLLVVAVALGSRVAV